MLQQWLSGGHPMAHIPVMLVMVILGQLQVEWVASRFKLFKYGVLTH